MTAEAFEQALDDTDKPNQFDFDAMDLGPRVIDNIVYKGKQYRMREVSEAVAIQYQDMRMKSAIMDNDRLVGFKGGSGVRPFLLSNCLYEVTGDNRPLKGSQYPGERPVTIEQIRTWHPLVTKRLYKQAVKLSHLEDEDKPRHERIAELKAELNKLLKEEEEERLLAAEGNGQEDEGPLGK